MCASDHKAVEAQQAKSGGAADGQRGSELVEQQSSSRRSMERATVAEPDSTMSNETMPADAERRSTALDHYDDRNTSETARRHDDDDATGSGGRDFPDRFRRWGFDGVRSGRGSEAAAELGMHGRAHDAEYVEPSSSEMNDKRGPESVLGGGWTSRKRQMYPDAELESQGRQMPPSSAVTGDWQAADGAWKKHRPDPLVLPPPSTEHYGYPSWLRSPRAWNGHGAVPYTPPPMLSPARRAPGLFWAAARAQNQPPFWSSFRQPSAFTCELSSYVNTA